MVRRSSLSVGSATARPGQFAQGELLIAKQITGTSIAFPIRLAHGKHDGPTVWLSAAIHGDEIGGVEIIRQVLAAIKPASLRGSIIAVPVVNVHGFLTGDRYLPDRRDLNRSFPGSARGSLAAQVAHLFTSEIVDRCDVGIDLHSGSNHRTNLPQIRADLDDAETCEMATAFGAPVVLHSRLRDGSLREIAVQRSARVLLYEGGEALRFDEAAIDVGTSGVLRVLRHLDMIDDEHAPDPAHPTMCRTSKWVRARRSGICSLSVTVGDEVSAGQDIGVIRDAFGKTVSRCKASSGGIVIGHIVYPLVNQGDAIVHLAQPTSSESAST